MGAEITADWLEIKIAGCLTMSGRDTWMVRSQRHRRRENIHRDRVTDNRDIVHVCECPADTTEEVFVCWCCTFPSRYTWLWPGSSVICDLSSLYIIIQQSDQVLSYISIIHSRSVRQSAFSPAHLVPTVSLSSVIFNCVSTFTYK